MKQQRSIGVLLVAISGASFGVMPVLAKVAYGAGGSVYTVLFLRFLIAAAFIFPLMFALRLPLPPRKDAIIYFLLGAVFYVGQSLCYFLALKHMTASATALLLYTYPALVTLGSFLVLKEKITAPKLVALVLALAGAFVVSSGNVGVSPLGIVFALLSAICYSVYILINARVTKEGMGLQQSAFIMVGSAVVFGLMNFGIGFEPPMSAGGLACVAAIALVSTALAFWAFLTGLEMVGPTTASIVSTLEPVVAVMSSVIVLTEPLTLNILVGGALVLAALFVVLLPSGSTAKH